MHKSSYFLMNAFKNKYLSEKTESSLNILDIGSLDINGSYRNIFSEKMWAYYGLDLEPGKNVDIVVKSPYIWKQLPNNHFDVVISGQAFEHMEYPWLTMFEIYRVLKPSGICCIIAPSSGYEHRHPIDCWRFYPDGFYALAKIGGFKVLETNIPLLDNEFLEENNIWKDSILISQKKSTKYCIHRIFMIIIRIMTLRLTNM